MGLAQFIVPKRCPNCSISLHGIVADGEMQLQENDITLCIYCAHIMQLTKDGRFILLHVPDIEAIMNKNERELILSLQNDLIKAIKADHALH